MASPSLPAPGYDGGAPDDSAPGASSGNVHDTPDEEEWELPAWLDNSAEEFAPGGMATAMGPGPALGCLVHGAVGAEGKGLAALSEDQLLAVIAAARRLESRAAWTQLAAIAEFAARRAAGPPGHAEFAAEELGWELGLTGASAAAQMGYASAVATRLPRTFAALAAGAIHPVAVRIIEDETRVLSDGDAATADEKLAEAARDKTFGQLRHAAHRVVLKLDPEAAQRRKEAARREAQLRWFREQSGNGGMTARELPADELLASQQHVEQRAVELRAAGVPGSLRELRIRAWLDLTQERDSRQAPAEPAANAADGHGGPDDDSASGDDPRGGGGTGGPGPRGHGPAGTRPGGQGTGGPGRDTGPGLAALITITVPLGTAVGQSAAPGEAGGFGLLDADTARDVLAAAARDPRTRWCVTALHPDGTAAAHACAPGRHQDATGLRGLKLRFRPVIRGPCDHAQAEPGYRPSRNLVHLVRARTPRCSAPGCNRPAMRCDLDHTVAWADGGPTCPCNIAPLCRRHHRCKQAEGWSLAQPEPGVMVWLTPAGRTHVTTPTAYPR
jgi:hypothetical protein